jgi:hypothetical protein
MLSRHDQMYSAPARTWSEISSYPIFAETAGSKTQKVPPNPQHPLGRDGSTNWTSATSDRSLLVLKSEALVHGDRQGPPPSGTPTTPAKRALPRDRRFSAGARAIVERGHRAFRHGARRRAGPSDDAARALDLLKKTTGLPDRQAICAPARPALPVPFAIALSILTSTYPNLRATIQSPAATLTMTLLPRSSWAHAPYIRVRKPL